MQKIEASKLLTKIFSEKLLDPAGKPRDDTRCVVILSDEPNFQKCVEDKIFQKTKRKPHIFTGTQALTQYNQFIRQNNLFEPVFDSLVILDGNVSKKIQNEILSHHDNTVFVFGGTHLRNVLSEKNFPHASFYLCYSPSDFERQTCVEILAKSYFLKTEDETKNFHSDISSIAEEVLLHYNSNLYHCALHFERMQKSGLSFQDAKLFDVSVSTFDIVNALLEESLDLLDARLYQYSSNGEEAALVLNGLVYFFKQLAFVHGELASHSNLNTALMNVKVPYPAQDRIKKALKIIPYKKIEHFFSVCAQLEIDLRERKNAHQILFLELSQFIG